MTPPVQESKAFSPHANGRAEGWAYVADRVGRLKITKFDNGGPVPGHFKDLPLNALICSWKGAGACGIRGGDYDGDIFIFSDNLGLLRFFNINARATDFGPLHSLLQSRTRGHDSKTLRTCFGSQPTRLKDVNVNSHRRLVRFVFVHVWTREFLWFIPVSLIMRYSLDENPILEMQPVKQIEKTKREMKNNKIQTSKSTTNK